MFMFFHYFQNSTSRNKATTLKVKVVGSFAICRRFASALWAAFQFRSPFSLCTIKKGDSSWSRNGRIKWQNLRFCATFARALENLIDTLRWRQWKDPHCFNLGGGFTYFYTIVFSIFFSSLLAEMIQYWPIYFSNTVGGNQQLISVWWSHPKMCPH